MSRNIKISEKHGVNPTIPVCFWCGGQKNEVALLGKLPGDAEAPMSMWIPGDYEPCDICMEKMTLGITIMEAADHPAINENQPSMVENAYPTGRWMVVTEDGIKKLLSGKLLDHVLKARKTFTDQETYDQLIKIYNYSEEENNG